MTYFNFNKNLFFRISTTCLMLSAYNAGAMNNEASNIIANTSINANSKSAFVQDDINNEDLQIQASKSITDRTVTLSKTTSSKYTSYLLHVYSSHGHIQDRLFPDDQSLSIKIPNGAMNVSIVLQNIVYGGIVTSLTYNVDNNYTGNLCISTPNFIQQC